MDNRLNHYNALAPHRFGLYWDRNRPAIFIRDLELIKQIQITDFDHFTDLGFNHPEYLAKVGNALGLADMQGEEWKKLKRMVTPPFSVPRLKKTVPAMNVAAEKLKSYLKSKENAEFVNAVDFTKKFYMTTVASVLYGIDINCFGDEQSEFEKKGKGLLLVPKFIIKDLFPSLAILFKIKFIDPDSEKFFSNLCRRIVHERKNLKMEVKDVLGNLINVAEENPAMTEEMMYKTCVQFFTDGYETASAAISVLIYYLAVNQEIQEKVQEEIDEMFENKGENTQVEEKDLNGMPYLDQVLSEGLRHGCLSLTSRFCTKPWKIPGDNFVIPKDMKVMIPIVGLHFDPQYWEDPFKFDPERFSPENKSKIQAGSFQPFGIGPRACLGQNLMRMESKVLLIHLLRNFSLKPHGHMPERIVWEKDAMIASNNINIRVVGRYT